MHATTPSITAIPGAGSAGETAISPKGLARGQLGLLAIVIIGISTIAPAYVPATGSGLNELGPG